MSVTNCPTCGETWKTHGTACKMERLGSFAAPHGSASHPAFNRTWWMNLYPNGQCTGTLCETRESALNRCTYTGEIPDATQVEVRIVPVTPNND